MGFPDSFLIPVSDMRAYKQFGNSVIVDVMREMARVMAPFISVKNNMQPELPILAA
jgi:DNA (cytosine-5)-methyltransferase 1